MEIFCFVMGVLFVLAPNPYLPLAVVCIYFVKASPSIYLFFILGSLLAYTHQWLVKPFGMPAVDVIPQALVYGTIQSIPVQSTNKTSFNFAVEKLNNKRVKALLQLTWYNHAPILHAKETWLLRVKLKKPHNFINPGSYDYLGALESRHIFWTGYVLPKANQKIAKAPSFDVTVLREHLGNKLLQLAADRQSAGVLQALTLNLNALISQDNWELFRRTGTTHLFGISGEHIALVSGMVYWLLNWLWTRSARLCLYLPAMIPASLGGFFAACIYSLLAGFAAPVQRALIGCFFYTLCCVGRHRLSSWQIWRYALVGVLCFEPHAALSQGFYFSFIAVACLLICHQRWRLPGFRQVLVLQAACLLGLMPLSLYWFSYGSINGFLANVFAIPLIGFLIIPLALIALVLSSWSWDSLLIKVLSWLIALLFKILNQTEQWSGLNLEISMPSIGLALALMSALLLWIVLPIKPFKWIALFWFLLPWIPSSTRIGRGEALIQVLDVGQGLAVSIRTADHVLLYDTGDQFFQGSDLGKMVILPFYKAMNVRKIDKIVISHPDKDHRGGLLSIQEAMPVQELIVNNLKYYKSALVCHHYSSWEWEGVRFRFFPIRMPFKDKNNTSCILQVSTKAGNILLTGDIEAKAEDYLVKTYGNQMASELLLVPHHGSKTSSSYRFLMEVAPHYAIASLGFDNRFHFPHAKTLKNMNTLGIDFYRTDQCGMVETLLPAKGIMKKPICYRAQAG